MGPRSIPGPVLLQSTEPEMGAVRRRFGSLNDPMTATRKCRVRVSRSALLTEPIALSFSRPDCPGPAPHGLSLAWSGL